MIYLTLNKGVQEDRKHVYKQHNIQTHLENYIYTYKMSILSKTAFLGSNIIFN